MRAAASAVTAVFVLSLSQPALPVTAQEKPVNGIRPADLRAHAIVGARVVVAPGRVLDEATVVMRDGVIEAVGPGLAAPPDARPRLKKTATQKEFGPGASSGR